MILRILPIVKLGFDYLRDNMVVNERRIEFKDHLNFAIIDEVDSVLIDEARTPLIISGGRNVLAANLYIDADRFAKTLKEEEDYHIMMIKTKSVHLTATRFRKSRKNVPC